MAHLVEMAAELLDYIVDVGQNVSQGQDRRRPCGNGLKASRLSEPEVPAFVAEWLRP
jgi:hypothetical protein